MLEIHAIRREDLLTAFSLSADLLLRSRLYAFAERKVLLKRNTLGEAVNRRNEKKAFSAATSFFPFRQPLRGSERGEQPLSRGSSASKSLVVFWFSIGTQKRT